MRTSTIVLAVLLALTMSCGGSNKVTSPPVSGAYEFVVKSSVTGAVTLVEANLAATGNQSSASGPNEVQMLTLEKKIWYVNGVCVGDAPGQNSVTANVSGNNIGVIFNDGGYVLPGQGVLAGSTITGNYAVTGSTCSNLIGEIGYPPGTDSGGFVGNQVPALAGTFAGVLNLPNGVDNAALTLTEQPDFSLTVSAQLAGPVDNGTFPLTGTAVGNVIFVSGPVGGQTLSLFGYFDRSGAFTGMPNSIMVINYATLSNAGLLLGQ